MKEYYILTPLRGNRILVKDHVEREMSKINFKDFLHYCDVYSVYPEYISIKWLDEETRNNDGPVYAEVIGKRIYIYFQKTKTRKYHYSFILWILLHELRHVYQLENEGLKKCIEWLARSRAREWTEIKKNGKPLEVDDWRWFIREDDANCFAASITGYSRPRRIYE